LITQINDVLCYFRSLDSFVNCDLLYRYCNSLYGSVLWSLQDNEINRICSAWRIAIKRAWNLPRNTHCNIVTKLSGRLAIFDKLCKRKVKFHYECLNSPNKLVNTRCKYIVSDGTPLSPQGRNLLFICNHYNIVDTLGLLANRRRYNSVMSRVMTHLNMRYTDVNDDNFNVLMELLMIKNGFFYF
jgi:hypothetical protein